MTSLFLISSPDSTRNTSNEAGNEALKAQSSLKNGSPSSSFNHEHYVSQHSRLKTWSAKNAMKIVNSNVMSKDYAGAFATASLIRSMAKDNHFVMIIDFHICQISWLLTLPTVLIEFFCKTCTRRFMEIRFYLLFALFLPSKKPDFRKLYPAFYKPLRHKRLYFIVIWQR